MKNILWLASWYPSDEDYFAGDFVKRHACSTSLFHPIDVIFVVKRNTARVSDSIKCIKNQENGLTEYICYYPKRWQKDTLISKIYSVYTYYKVHKRTIEDLIQKNKFPDIIHVQIAMKAGLIALYLKWKYKIPYVITENWTGYYDQSTYNVKQRSFIYKYLLKRIFSKASVFLPVTKDLGETVNRTITKVPYSVIPNVVDTSLFFYQPQTLPSDFCFVHASSLIYQKNIEGILKTFKRFLDDGFDAQLTLIGPASFELKEYIEKLQFPYGKLLLAGEISYEEVAEKIKASSAFLLFSRFENLPCVVLEALCCGLPVIASRVGGLAEVVNETNGILVDNEDESQLLAAMKKMVNDHSNYNRQAISAAASSLFNYETVGKQYIDIYNKILTT